MIGERHWKYVIYALMTGYVLFIVASMYQIDLLVKKSEDYAIQASRAARELRYMCTRLDEILPDLYAASNISPDRKELRIRQAEESIRESEERLAAALTGKSRLVERLRHELRELGNLAEMGRVKFEGNESRELALSFYQHTVHPQNKLVNQIIDEVAEEVAGSLGEMQDYVHGRIRLVILASLLSGLIIIIGVMYYDRRVAAGQKALAYRERLFQQLADSIDEIFIIAANSREFEYISSNTRRILGMSSRKLFEDPQSLYDLLSPEDREWLVSYLDGDGPVEALERDVSVPSRDMDLKIRVYSICVASLREERIIVVISDQTAAVRHQQALSDSLEVARSASAAKSSFLSHISHEIRTPMNAIIGMTTIALSRISDQFRVKDCLVKISDSSRHLLGLINDVLDMSRIEAGKLAICHEQFNLQDVVENMQNIVLGQAKSRGLLFDIVVENVENEVLIGDVMRLNQVLLNILSNALKFTPADGKVSLRIAQLNRRGTEGIYRFVITDTGIGMSPDFLKRLYQPFEQAADNTASRYGGTGLGMSITANLINMMGGNIRVESEEGAGSRFFIELPFDIAEVGGEEGDALSALQILAIHSGEDDALCGMLQKMGHHVEKANTVEEACNLLDRQDRPVFAVCLIDWQLANAGEIVAALREKAGSAMQILAICGQDCAAIEGVAREAGCDDVLGGPFFVSTVEKALAAAVERLGVDQGGNEEQTTQYDFTGKRILLAEDNEFNTEIAVEFLEMVNAEVDHAENGREAVSLFTGAPPGYYDLVLMDVQMPLMGGYEATRAIRTSDHADAATIPILALTANAFNEDVARATASGMNGHLAKPIDIQALYQALARYLCKGGKK